MRDLIEDHIPTEGIIPLYMEYTSGGEICPRFRFFSFLAALGSILNRKVLFQRSFPGVFPTLYPNLWLILVAPQGVGHKSSALRASRKFLEELPLELQPRFLASKITPEALVKALASQSINMEIKDAQTLKLLRRSAQGLLYSSELGVLLGKEKYNNGMIALLTDLYDCDDEWYSETVMRGDQRLYDICINIMAASTPDWMQTMLPPDAFKGGFMSRLFLVGFPEGWRKRVADPPVPPAEIRTSLVTHLQEIALIKGTVEWTPRAKSYFSDWYHALKEVEPGPRASYIERKQDHLLRIAILLQIALNKSLKLERSSVEQALACVDSVENDTLRMVDYISVEPKMRIVQHLLEYMKVMKRCKESDLLLSCYRFLSRPSEFDEVIRMLLKTKLLNVTFQSNETYYEYKGE